MRKILSIVALLHIALSFQVVFGQVEICWNRIDDDGDGLIDCSDTDCQAYNFCFDCDNTLYKVINHSQLVELDIANQMYSDPVTLDDVTKINGVAMNPIDGHVYASSIGTDGDHNLLLVGKDGTLVELDIELNGSSVYYMAAIDNAGIMYLANNKSSIIRIDLNETVLTWTNTGIPATGSADLAYHYDDAHIYGLTNKAVLMKINPVTTTVVKTQLIGSINNDSGHYGSLWSTVDGGLFAANNTSGKIYSIDIDTYIATEVMDATGSASGHDGFSCGRAATPFEVDCENGIDDDGDGLIDCADPDCLNSNSCLVEICDNGIDDDGDGFIDCEDAECQSITVCVEICDNGIDDNGDGLIDEEDSQCNTTGGNSAGLESNRRLGHKIATRNFVRKKEDLGAKHFPVFHARPIDPNMRSGFDMGVFIPADAFAEAITMNTSPEDLVDITNAKEVISTDYIAGDRRIASMLLLKTENGTYEHTKYICDRLDGAQIKNISTLYFNDEQFITTEIIQADGSVEYVCSFAAYIDNKGTHIENHWLKEYYSEKAEMYNFQIWANDIATLTQLIEATLVRINESTEIASIETSIPPRVFVSHGKISNGKLDLHIINKNQSENLSLLGRHSATELSNTESTYEKYSLTKSVREVITLDMTNAYDIGFRLSTEYGAMDDLFFADGPWGTDFDKNTNQLLDYTITPSESINDTEAYLLNRDVTINADVNSSINIFRGLGAKFKPVNIDAYNNFTFTASGNTSVSVIVVKESIVLWEDQPRINVRLGDETKKYTLSKSDFSGKEGPDWKDVKMVVFEVINAEGNTKEVQMELRSLNFNNSETAMIIPATEEGKIIVHPNPFVESTSYHMQSDIATSYEMSLIDNTGKTIEQEKGSLIPGINSFSLNKMESMLPGIYFLQIISGEGNIYTTKIMLTAQ